MNVSTDVALLPLQPMKVMPFIVTVSIELKTNLLEPVHIILQLEEALVYTDIEKQLLVAIEN